MIVLGIDTASRSGGVALRLGPDRVRVRDLGERGRHAEALTPAVLELLAEGGVSWNALDRVAVNEGPGSFTGIRVGVAFALGVAEARGVPAVGVGSLDIGAWACYHATSPGTGVYIVSTADVRRGEVVWRRYRVAPEGPVAVEAERTSPAGEPEPAPEPGTRLAGDAGTLLWPDASGLVRWSGSGGELATAAALLGERAGREAAGSPPVPRYARPADARPRRKRP